jgi:hypothetical protein
VYLNWGKCDQQVSSDASSSQILPLIKEKGLKLSYQIAEKALKICGYFKVQSNVDKICELILTENRSEWDLRLDSFSESNPGLELSYKVDKHRFVFNCDKEKQKLAQGCKIKIAGVLENEMGEFTQEFNVEIKNGNDSVDFDDGNSIRCNWTYETRGRASKLFLYDVLGEEDLIQRSFRKLRELAQEEGSVIEPRMKRNSFYEAVCRKIEFINS